MTAGRRGHGKRHAPRHGTKQRELLLLMLRPQGVMAKELDLAPGNFAGRIERLRSDYDYDIRQFQLKRPTGAMGRPALVYRLVGKWSRTGRYRSFLGDKIQSLVDKEA